MKLTATIIQPQSVTVEANPTTIGIGLGTPAVRIPVERDPYTGDYSVTPSGEQQTLVTDGKRMTDDMTIEAIPADYVGSAIERRTSDDLLVTGSTVNVPAGFYAENEGKAIPDATHASPSSLTVNPTLEVDYDTGTITATNSASADVAPINDDGYATLAFTHRINVSGNTATQLYTIGASTYTPSGSIQTIPAGRLLTGDQTISAVAPPFYDMSGDMAWLGKGAELVGQDFYKKVDTLDNTLYADWSPSTTAKAIVASVTLSDNKFTATDVDQYAYYIIWECGVDIAYTGSPTLKALPTFGRALIIQNLVKRPDTMANIQATNCNATVNQAAYTASFLRYYGTTTGSITYTWSSSNGLYFTATAPTISSTTAVSPTITPKTPVFNAKVSTTYMSTASANAIDQENTKWWIKGTRIYKVKRECFFDGIYRYMCGVVNSTAPSS